MKSSRKKKGIVGGLLALVLVLALMATTAFAEDHTVNLGSTAPAGVTVTGELNQGTVSGAITDIVLKADNDYRPLGKTQENIINEKLKGTGLTATWDKSTEEITISGRPSQDISDVDLSSLITNRKTNEYSVLVWSDDNSGEGDDFDHATVAAEVKSMLESGVSSYVAEGGTLSVTMSCENNAATALTSANLINSYDMIVIVMPYYDWSGDEAVVANLQGYLEAGGRIVFQLADGGYGREEVGSNMSNTYASSLAQALDAEVTVAETQVSAYNEAATFNEGSDIYNSGKNSTSEIAGGTLSLNCIAPITVGNGQEVVSYTDSNGVKYTCVADYAAGNGRITMISDSAFWDLTGDRASSVPDFWGRLIANSASNIATVNESESDEPAAEAPAEVDALADGDAITTTIGNRIENPSDSSADSIAIRQGIDKDTITVPTTGGKVIINDTEYVVGANNTTIIANSDGNVTLPSGSFAVPANVTVKVNDVTYTNEGASSESIAVLISDSGKDTVTIPSNGSLTRAGQTYTAGDNGATLEVDDSSINITAGSTWLDIGKTIEVATKEVTNKCSDTIEVSATTAENVTTGSVTIPESGAITVDGKKISAFQDTVVKIGSSVTVTVPASGSIKIDGQNIIGCAGSEMTVTISAKGNVSMTVPDGKTITVCGNTVSGSDGTTVAIEDNGISVTIPTKGNEEDAVAPTATINGKEYSNSSTKEAIKITVTGETYKLTGGSVTLGPDAYITVGYSNSVVKNEDISKYTSKEEDTSEGEAAGTSAELPSITVTAKSSGDTAEVSVPKDGQFSLYEDDAISHTGKNTTKKSNVGPVIFEIDAEGDVYISQFENDQKAEIDGSEYKWLALSDSATGTINAYTTSVTIPITTEVKNGRTVEKPFAVYSIYFTGTNATFTVPQATGGKFENGVNGNTNVAKIIKTGGEGTSKETPLTSVQYTTGSGATVAQVKADLSAIVYKGAGTVTITATKYAAKDGDVYYNGHYYHLNGKTSNSKVTWKNAMDASTEDLSNNKAPRYSGYKGHPITVTSVGENNMLITLLKECYDDKYSKGTLGQRIWLGAVPANNWNNDTYETKSECTNAGDLPVNGADGTKDGDGSGWKWIKNTPEAGNAVSGNNISTELGNLWGTGQPDADRTEENKGTKAYVIYIGIQNTRWDDLVLGSLTSTLAEANYVIEYSPYDSTTNSWIYSDATNKVSATSGFSSVQSTTATYNSDNIGNVAPGKSMVGVTGKTIKNSSDANSGIVIIVEGENGKDIVTIPTKGGKVIINGREYTAESNNTVLVVTTTEDPDSGTETTTIGNGGGSVTLTPGKSVIVGDGKVITNTGSENIVVTVSGGDGANKEITIPAGGEATIDGKTVKNETPSTGEGTGIDKEIKAKLDDGKVTTDIPTGGKATVGGTTYTAGTGGAKIETSKAEGDLTNKLTDGSVVLDKGETINIGDKVLKNTGNEEVTITKKTSGGGGDSASSGSGYTADIPVGGSISVDGNTFKNTDTEEAKVGIDEDNGTINLPKGAKGDASGDINVTITDENGEDKTVPVTIPKGKVYGVDGDQIDGYQKDDEIKVNGLTLTLDGNGNNGGFSLDDTAKADGSKYNADGDNGNNGKFTLGNDGDITLTDGSGQVPNGESLDVKIGDKEIPIAPDENNGDTKTTVTTDSKTGKGTVTMSGDGKVTIGDKTYTAGEGGAKFTVDEDGNAKLTNGKAKLADGESIDASVGGKDIKVKSNAGEGNTATVTTDETAGTINVDKKSELTIGSNTYNTGDTGATFTVGKDGKETLTAGSVDLTSGKEVNVGIGKTSIKAGANTSLTVNMGTSGSEEGKGFTIPEGGSAEIAGVNVYGSTSEGAGADVDVKLDASGKATVTIPTDGKLMVGGKTISGPAGTKVEIDSTGKVTVIAPENGGEIKVGDKTYTTTGGDKFTIGTDSDDTARTLTSGSATLGNDEQIKVNGTTIKNESGDGVTDDVNVVVNSDGSSNVTIPAGGAAEIGGKTVKGSADTATDVTIDANGKATMTVPTDGTLTVGGNTVSGPEGTKVEIDAKGNVTVNAPSAGEVTITSGAGTAGEKSTTYTTTASNTKIKITDSGNVLQQGGLKLGDDESIIGISGKTITGSGSGENGVTVTANNITKEDTVTVPNGGTVNIGGNTYTAGANGAKLVANSFGNVSITGGETTLGEGKTISAGGKMIKSVANGTNGGEVKVGVTTNGATGAITETTVSIPAGGKAAIGSTSVGGDADTEVRIDASGKSTVTIPDGKKVTIGDNEISGPSGTTVEIDKNGKVTVKLPASGGSVTIGDKTYSNLSGNSTIELGENDNKITQGTNSNVKLGDENKSVIGTSGKTITKPEDSNANINVDTDTTTKKDTVTVTGGGDVNIGGTTYTAGSGETKLVVDENGDVELTKGSVTLDDEKEKLKVNGMDVYGKDGNTDKNKAVTVTKNADGSGTVDIPAGGSATIGGKTVNAGDDAGSTVTIGTDGKASLSVPEGKTADINGAELAGPSGSAGDTAFTFDNDGVTIPSSATVSTPDGKSTIKGVEASGAGSKATKVDIDDKGNLTLVEGKGEVTGSPAEAGETGSTGGSTVSVKVGNKTVEVKVPADETYTIDAEKGTVGVLAKDETVTIGGVTYTAGSEGKTFSIASNALASGDKASVPEKTGASIKLGTGSSAPTVVVSNANTGTVDVEQGATSTTIKVAKKGDKFTIKGKTYTAAEDGATYTVDSKGNVVITYGTTSVGGNKKLTAGNTSYTSGKAGATITNNGKLTDGSAKLDNNTEIKVGITTKKEVDGKEVEETKDITIKNLSGDGKQIEVDKDGNVDVPAGGKVQIGEETYEVGDEGGKLTIDADGKVKLTDGTLKVSENGGKADVKVNGTNVEVTGAGSGNDKLTVTADADKGTVGVNGKATVKIGDDTYNTGDSGATFTVDKDGKGTLTSGSVVLDGTGSNKESLGINGATIKGKTGSVTVTMDNAGNGKVTIPKDASATISGATITGLTDTDAKVTIDKSGKATVTIPAGGKIKIGDKEIEATEGSNGTKVEITADGKVTVTVTDNNGTVKIDGTEYNVGTKNTKLTLDSEGNVEAIAQGSLKVADGKSVAIGDKTYKATGEGVTIASREDSDGNALTPSITLGTTGSKVEITQPSSEQGAEAGKTETVSYTAANAGTKLALAGDGSDAKNIELLDNNSSSANSALKFTDKTSYKVNGVTYTGASSTEDKGYTVTYGKADTADGTINSNKVTVEDGGRVIATLGKGKSTNLTGKVGNTNVTDKPFVADSDNLSLIIANTNGTTTISGSGSYLTEVKSGDIVTGYKISKLTYGGGSKVKEEQKDDQKDDQTDITSEEAIANAKALASKIQLKARSVKTPKGNIKVTLKVTKGKDSVQKLEDLGYTLKYQYYRSVKKSSGYKAKFVTNGKPYTNTDAKKGTRYYYRARIVVYDAQGNMLFKTNLKKCWYATRVS